MKRRAKRRVFWLAWVVAAAAVFMGVVHHVSDSTGSARPTTTTPAGQESGGEQNAGIAYGDSESTVLAKLGRPTTKQAACWVYDTHGRAVNGMDLGASIDGIKFCFGDGPVGGKVVANIYEHFTARAVATLPRDKRPAGGWIHALIFMPKAQQHLKF